LNRNPSPALVAVIFVALALHLFVAWQGFATLARNGFLYDDSFYAFQIARNIANGVGATFDGTTLTNGFQPLYVFMLVPIFAVFGSEPTLPVHLALTLLALFTVATSILLYRIARRYMSEGVAVGCAAVWVLSPVAIRQTAGGLETAVAAFFFAAAIDYYLSRLRPHSDAPRGVFVRMGLLLGLATLARIDLAFLGLAMALDFLLVARQRGRLDLTGLFSTAGTALLVCAPWLIFGMVAVGSPFQQSGPATRFLSIVYAPYFQTGPPTLMHDGPNAAFMWTHLVHAFSVLKVNPVTHVLFRSLEKAGEIAPAIASPASVFAMVLAPALLIGFVWFVVWSRSRREAATGELAFLLLFSVMLIAAYSFYVFGGFFFIRYLYPIYFVAVLYSGLIAGAAVSAVRRWPLGWRRTALATAAMYAILAAAFSVSTATRSRPVSPFYDVALWIQQNTDKNDTVGVFQSGAIGYLSDRRVVNLDGKVNRDAYNAMREDRLASYVEQTGVNVLFDNVRILKLFFGPPESSRLERHVSNRVFKGEVGCAPGWVGYRLLPTVVGGSPSSAGSNPPK